jgi:hypothetical protein
LIRGRGALYATPTLRDAQNPSGWWPSRQCCEPSQVLSDGSQNECELRNLSDRDPPDLYIRGRASRSSADLSAQPKSYHDRQIDQKRPA